MNKLILLALLVVSACSKSPNGGSASERPMVVEFEPITIAVSATVPIAGSLLNLGDVPTGATRLTPITISSSINPTYALVINSVSPGLTYTMSPTTDCPVIRRGKNCTITVSYKAGATVPSPETISEEIVINNAVFTFNGKVISPVAPLPVLSVPALNLGIFAGEMKTQSFQITNQNGKTIPAGGIAFDLTGLNPDFTVNSNDCTTRSVSNNGKCLIVVTYNSTDMTAATIVSTIKIGGKPYDLTVVRDVPILEKIALAIQIPASGLLDFGDKEQNKGEVAKTVRVYNDSGRVQYFTVPAVLADFVSTTCTTVSNNGICTITVRFNSNGKNIQEYTETFLMENDKYKIEFNIRANVTAPNDAILCDLTNSVSGGGVLNLNNAVTAVEGFFPLCTVKTCQPLYNISGDLKSCEPIVMACTAIDATANGVNFTNSTSAIIGSVIAGNVQECLLSETACDLNYVRNVNGKSCEGDVRICTQADALINGVNILGINPSAVPVYLGSVVAGNTSACLINQCDALYTKDVGGKKCILNERACIASDITTLGGNITNAATYSGLVLLENPAACKIATCTGAFEPNALGLACEDQSMSDLAFTITNKNTNGYIKVSSAELAITATKALEMKVSESATCAGGIWEPYAATKSLAISAPNLNALVASPISIQFRRNTQVSACIHAAGLISLANSSLYRHDNVAPTPLTIATPTENQAVTSATISMTGTCESGINIQTGLLAGTLVSAPCSGSYTAAPISLTTDGNISLYIKQEDLAGNISELTRIIVKSTACDATNAVGNGVTSTYAATAYSGTIATGCLISTCSNIATKAADSRSCTPKAVSGGSLRIINKNADGYVKDSFLSITSVSATNAQFYDIFDNQTCTGTPIVNNNPITTTTATITIPAVALNNPVTQGVSLIFRNGNLSTACITSSGLTNTFGTVYIHDTVAPTGITVSSTAVSNGGTIANTALTSLPLAGSCEKSLPVKMLFSATAVDSAQATCSPSTGTYSFGAAIGALADGSYTLYIYQVDLAGNISGQVPFTFIKNAKRFITINKPGSNSGTGTIRDAAVALNCGGVCSSSYTIGSSVVLTAIPASNSTFTNWGTISGAASTTGCGATTTCTVVMGSTNVTIQPVFTVLPSFALTVAKAGAGTGTVTSDITGTSGSLINCGATCSQNYYNSQSVTLTAVAAANSVFESWSGACVSTSSTCVVATTAAKSVTANFRLKLNYILTFTKSGTGDGTAVSSPAGLNCGATCSASFQEGSVVTLSASPDANSDSGAWGGECNGVSVIGSCEISMSSAKSASKVFTAKPVNPAAVGAIVTTDSNKRVYAVLGKNKTRLDDVGGLFAGRLTAAEISAGWVWGNVQRISDTEFLINKKNGSQSKIYIVDTIAQTFTQQGYTPEGVHYNAGDTTNYVYSYYYTGTNYSYVYVYDKINKYFSTISSNTPTSCRQLGTNGVTWCINGGVYDSSSASAEYLKNGARVSLNPFLYPTKYLGSGAHTLSYGGMNHVYNDRLYLFSRYGEGKILKADGTFTTFFITDGSTVNYQLAMMYKNYILYWNGNILMARNMDNISEVKTVYTSTGTIYTTSLNKNAKLDMINIETSNGTATITNATNGLASGTFSVNTTSNYYNDQISANCIANKLIWDYGVCWPIKGTVYNSANMFNDPEGIMATSPVITFPTLLNVPSASSKYALFAFTYSGGGSNYVWLLTHYNDSTKKYDVILRTVPGQSTISGDQYIPKNSDQP